MLVLKFDLRASQGAISLTSLQQTTSSDREATLCALPIEPFEQIISYLDDKVLPKLRLTRKGVHGAVNNLFYDLQSLTLIGASVRMMELNEVLRRSYQSLEYLELVEVALGDGPEQAWLGVFNQFAASENLCTLKSVLPNLWHRDRVSTGAVNILWVSRVETGVSTRPRRHMFGSTRSMTFTNRSELLAGLARLVGSELGTSCAVIYVDTDLEDGS